MPRLKEECLSLEHCYLEDNHMHEEYMQMQEPHLCVYCGGMPQDKLYCNVILSLQWV